MIAQRRVRRSVLSLEEPDRWVPRVVTLSRLSEKSLDTGAGPWYVSRGMDLHNRFDPDLVLRVLLIAAGFLAGWLSVALQHV